MPEPSPTPSSPRHWLIAAWPGMANVALIAAGHLVRHLGLKPIAAMPPHSHFDIQAVEVKEGVIEKPSMPRNQFFTGLVPGTQLRLTVFLGDAQPSFAAFAFAHELLEKSKEFGIDRILTFASIATQIHPTADASVFGAATSRPLVDELARREVKILGEGQIGGLNGVLLGAAAQRNVPGLCLLGEIPYFAMQIPNPKAARSILEMFGQLAGITLNLDELSEHAAKIENVLMQLLEKVQSGQPEHPEFPEPEHSEPEPNQATPAKPAEPTLDLASRQRIEALFEAARKDRSQAVALKQTLDSLGVYTRYENRFLDLFKRAE